MLPKQLNPAFLLVVPFELLLLRDAIWRSEEADLLVREELVLEEMEQDDPCSLGTQTLGDDLEPIGWACFRRSVKRRNPLLQYNRSCGWWRCLIQGSRFPGKIARHAWPI